MTRMNRGQSLVEVIVAIGIMALVVMGVAMLMTTALATKTKSFDRKKAVEMSEVVIEQLISEKNNNSTEFWNADSAYWDGMSGPLTLTNYPGYTYTVGFDTTVDGCVAGCGEATVTISWPSTSDTAEFTRLFTRY